MRGSKPLKNPEETGSDWSGFGGGKATRRAARAQLQPAAGAGRCTVARGGKVDFSPVFFFFSQPDWKREQNQTLTERKREEGGSGCWAGLGRGREREKRELGQKRPNNLGKDLKTFSN